MGYFDQFRTTFAREWSSWNPGANGPERQTSPLDVTSISTLPAVRSSPVRHPDPDIRTHRPWGAQRPSLPVRTGDEHLHRRMRARYVRAVPVRGHGRGAERRRVRGDLRGRPSRHAARDQPVPLASVSEAVVQALAFGQPGAPRRRGAYCALLDRLRHPAGHGGRAGPGHEPCADRRSAGRPCRLRVLAPSRRAQDRRRRKYVRGLVRDVRRPDEPSSTRFRVRLHHPLGTGRHGASAQACAPVHGAPWS